MTDAHPVSTGTPDDSTQANAARAEYQAASKAVYGDAWAQEAVAANRYIAALLAANAALRARVSECEAALEGVDELAAEGVNEFSLQEARRDFLDIRDVVADALVLLRSQAARPPAADTDAGGG